MKYLVLLARLLTGGIFIYASIHKIMDPADFAEAVRNYQMIPAHWSNFIAIVLPWIEIIVGAFLILGIQNRPSALVVTGMMAVFIVALSYAYATGLDINCGCFSTNPSSEGRITALTLMRDSSLILVALFILIWDRGHFSLWPLERGWVKPPAR